MNPKVSARLAFVCLGVLALMDSVLLLGGLFSTLSIAPRGDYNKPLMIVAAVVPFFMMAALGIYLILRSTRLCTWCRVYTIDKSLQFYCASLEFFLEE